MPEIDPNDTSGPLGFPRGVSLWTGEACDHCGMTWGYCCDCHTFLGPMPPLEQTTDQGG